jgi:hypothetical protein
VNSNINKPAIIEWLARLQTTEALYTLETKISMDPYIYSKLVDEFVQYTYDNNWVNADYQNIVPAWQDAPDKIAFIKTLDQAAVYNLLALHIRGDRFCAGMLAAAFDKNYVQTALQRLLEI